MVVEAQPTTGFVNPALVRLKRDLRAAREVAQELTVPQMRYLVDLYYSLQKMRVAVGNQAYALGRSGEPNGFIAWVGSNLHYLEDSLKDVMDRWTDRYEAGRWAKAQYGVGPVLAAGLLALIEPEHCITAGKVWRFAGLDPTAEWREGEKRPWNARLKTICWRIGDSFVKFHNRPQCFYGQVYAARKRLEHERNEQGAFAAQAKAILEKKRIQDPRTRAAYLAGRLPDGQIELRARRYAVKLFLSHFAWVLYESTYGTPPPKPYAIAILGHAHEITPPHGPLPEKNGRKKR